MTVKEIRQKAVEYSKTTINQRCCHPCKECEYGEYFTFKTDVSCLVVNGYEHGFADGVEEGKKQANLNHNIECGDCVRQITAADEERIRAEERRKFAEWFKKSSYYLCYSDTIDEVLAEYEKELKGEQT